MKLLIVDDHAPTRALIREFVGPLASEIRECRNGADAVTAYPDFRPDFVIMDLMMPGLNGFVATEHLRRLHADAAVILVSHASSREARDNARLAGACHYFAKDDLAALRHFLASAPRKQPAAG